jgi:hypothetical protein
MYPLDRMLREPQSRSGRRGEEKILYPTGTRTTTPRPSAIPTVLSRLFCYIYLDILTRFMVTQNCKYIRAGAPFSLNICGYKDENAEHSSCLGGTVECRTGHRSEDRRDAPSPVATTPSDARLLQCWL